MNDRSPSNELIDAPEGVSWPPAACPSWCTGGHQADDHSEDRIHRSRAVVVPATVRDSFLTDDTGSVDLLVYQSLQEGSSTVWCSITTSEGPGPRLHLTLESADLLRQALARALDAS